MPKPIAKKFKTLFRFRRLIFLGAVLILFLASGFGLYFWRQNQQGLVTLDLYGTSTDANTQLVEAALAGVKRRFGSRVAINVHLITDKNEKGDFISYNIVNQRADLADFDIQENMRQLVIKKYYPGDFLDFLVARNANFLTNNWQSAAVYVGIDDLETINDLIKIQGKKLLDDEIEDFKTWRAEVEIPPATIPNLLINGEVFTGSADLLAVSSAVVRNLLNEQSNLRSKNPIMKFFARFVVSTKKVKGVAGCYNDFHCDDRPDKEGFCEGAGTSQLRCAYRQPARVDLIVLAADGYDEKNDALLLSIKQNIKGTVARMVFSDTAEAQALQDQLKIANAPAYIFAKNLEETKYFALLKAQNNFVEAGDFYLLNLGTSTAGVNQPNTRGAVGPSQPAGVMEATSSQMTATGTEELRN